MKQFTVRARFDAAAGVWWASNERIPLTTEAASFEKLMARVMKIAPEILDLNGHVKDGEPFKINFTTDQVATVGA